MGSGRYKVGCGDDGRYERSADHVECDLQQLHCDTLAMEQHTRYFWPCLCLVTVVSLASRLWGLAMGQQVCWDETHFGRMAGWYHNRSYYFDVHPPAGRLLIAGLGKLVGYDGTYKFSEPGDDFSQHAEVLRLRTSMAVLGSLLVPVAFLTVWSITSSTRAATIAAVLIIFDTGMTTISRFILLDQPLLLAIALTFLALESFKQLPQESSFSRPWLLRLFLLGLCLGLAISVKFVGLFIVSYVGLFTIQELWIIFGDMKTTITTFLKHFLVRAAFLILLPLSVYVSFFMIHFQLLARSGPGDPYHSPLFQRALEGNFLSGRQIASDVTDGSGKFSKNMRGFFFIFISFAFHFSAFHVFPCF